MDKKQQQTQYRYQLPNTTTPRPFPLFLHITGLSAEALSISNQPITKNAFVTVQTDSYASASTSTDEDGGSYPAWKEDLQLPFPTGSGGRAGSITVEVQCKTSSGSRRVGMAKIPMSDIVGGYVPAHHPHFLSYRLRQADGGRNGIINVCVKVVGLESSGAVVGNNEVGGSSIARKSNNVAVALGIPVGYGHGVV